MQYALNSVLVGAAPHIQLGKRHMGGPKGGPSFPFLFIGVTVDAEAGMSIHSQR